MHNTGNYEFDKSDTVSPDSLTIQKLFERQADKQFQSEALLYLPEGPLSERQTLTYGELNRKANQLAIHLIKSGVKPNMLIGICMERSIDLIVGLLAILKAGGAYLPIDLSYPAERLTFMLEDASASLLITQRSLVDKIPQTQKDTICIDEFEFTDEITPNPDVKMNGSDLAYVIYTSGSTGKPNGVMVTHHNVVRLFRSTQPWFGFNENDIWTFFHTYAFDFSVWEIWGALLHGGKVIIVPYMLSRSPESFYDLLVREKVTVLNQTPSAFYQLIQTEKIKDNTDQLSLRYVIFGGEALNLAALKPWFERHGDKIPQLINMYGITETTVHVTYRPLTAQDTDAGSVIGIPIPDVEVYILDENLSRVKTGETGEIYVGGAGLSRGYLNRPDLNEKRFIKNPFSEKGNRRLYKTGDLGRLLENNDIEYLGRSDHQVKIRGFRIELGEIESIIRNYNGIRDCIVKVHKYSDDVVSILAYLISDKNISADDLKEHLKQFLPDYMVPYSYILLDKIPLTPNGKADLKALPVPELRALSGSGKKTSDENDDIENRLRQIWVDLLGYKNIGISDNFFDAGGNSLLMGRLQLMVNKEFQDNISIVDLFRYPTISSLSDFISKKEKTSVHTGQQFKSGRHPVENDIAIIGIAGKYPGAENINEFWQNLVNGVESISFFTDEELEYLPKGNLNSEIKFVRARGYLKDVDQFDAEFFGFNPREAAIMDPQHRIFLECAWAALEDAGYCAEKYRGSVGIFAGSSLNTYLIYNVLKDRQSAEEMVSSYQIADYTTLTGNDNAFLTTKIAYKLGLSGPAINVQTACSTSLVAIEQAYQSLISGQSDMALAGGVSVTFPQKRGYFFVDGSIGSEDGHCKPFDAEATGTVFSHGAGIVVLKRLKDAINDGDSIYAVIKSVAVNNDGSAKAGYMTPSVEGQSEVILKAQKIAGIDPSTINYVETHGTGTPVGDPIEVASLEKAFRESTDKKQFCGIGSVKSNLGHTDAAAGVTGLIKTALSLHHKVIPPTLHYKNPNPRIDFANSPFYVVDKLTDIRENNRPLRAAVSAFGVGGTNAHAILEEFPEISFSCEEEIDKYLIIISGKTENSLNGNMNALKDYLNTNPDEALNDVAYTLQTGRKEFEWRQFFVSDSCVTGAEEIGRIISSGLNKGKLNPNDKPHLVFMFPGQGAQYVNMGKGLYLREKVFREIVDEFAEYLKPLLGLDIRTLLFPEENSEEAAKNLEQTVYTQPALFIIEYALAQYLLSIGVQPASMIGHSVGDYAAACLAGVFSPEDALYIIAMRARLMQNQEPGSMLSVRLSEPAVKDYLNDDISLAATNSPNLSVLSGPTEKIKSLSDKLSELKIENRLLYTSHAYHSAMMEPALVPFLSEFSNIKLNKPTRPFISSMTGTWITDEQATDQNFWASQIRNTVRFSDGILELQKRNNLVMIEIGPGRALSTMASQHRNNDIKQTTITTLIKPAETYDDKLNLLNTLGKLWLSGINIEWKELYKGKKRRKLHLPAYQFDRKSYWIEPPVSKDNSKTISPTQLPGQLKKVVKKPKMKKVVQQSSMTRKEYIIDILKELLEELSGIRKADLDAARSFFELGFDSLFMTQVSLAFQKKFEVKITLRQLLDTAPTISAIADYIDDKLPEDKFNPPEQEIVIEEEGEEYEELLPSDQIDSRSQSIAESSPIEKLIRQQMELMKRQLDILQGKETESISEYQPGKKESKELPSAIPKVDKTEKKIFERFGPYNPIKTNKDGTLTEKQQKYLDKLITDYTNKTRSSKSLTQKYRAHYSDPRTVSGFLPIWKEMTYQVITNKSEGSKLWDLDGNEYIDVIMGFGQYMFGHNPKFVRDEIEKQLKLGFEIGPQSPIAGEVAQLICEFTGMDRAAFCVTGSEAVLGAIRAARTVTGKDKIVFFAGDYHGIIDEVLIKTIVNGDQVRTMPIAPGIPRENVQNTIALEYGTEESLKIIENLLPEIAGIMVEPVQARRPDFQPKEFLQKLRKITEDADIPLIFDEVITGFRTAHGGAQEWFGIKADIGTFGKVIGGGFPIGVIAGNKLYMDAFDGGYWQYGDDSIPEAGVTFFAGTFARHPLSLTACKAVLSYLKSQKGELQKSLNQKAKQLTEELNTFLMERNVPIKIVNFSSVIYYSHPKDLNYFSLLFYVLRHKGIHILEGFPMFLSEAHSDKDIRHIIDSFKESVIELQDNGFFPVPLKKVTTDPATKFPLSEAQKEIWIASMLSDKASCSYNESSYIDLKGQLNIEALITAFEKLIKRHESLRTTFTSDGRFQIVNDRCNFKLEVTDISSLEKSEKSAKVIARLDEETLKAFDLENGPLIRAELIKLDKENHRLIITAHHIVCDGWSYDVMVKDLSILYSQLVDKKSESLPQTMQMHEYISFMNEFTAGPDYELQLKYWLSTLSKPIEIVKLPADKERPLTRTFDGNRITKKISTDLFSDIKNLSIKTGNTLFVSLFSFYILLLYKLTGQEDLLIGIPAAGQQTTDSGNLVGHCTNLLPIRVTIKSDFTFVEFVKTVKFIVLDAYENQKLTYGELIKKLRLPREQSRAPLINAIFNVDPAIIGLKFKGIESSLKVSPRTAYQFEFGFNIVVTDNDCEIECDYNTNIFSESIIHQYLNYYENIVRQITSDNQKILSEIQILSASDMENIINILNDKSL